MLRSLGHVPPAHVKLAQTCSLSAEIFGLFTALVACIYIYTWPARDALPN
jgi:hypothetical protein